MFPYGKVTISRQVLYSITTIQTTCSVCSVQMNACCTIKVYFLMLLKYSYYCSFTFTFFMQVFKESHTYDDQGNSFELSLITYKCISAYVKNKKNQNQVVFYLLFSFFIILFRSQLFLMCCYRTCRSAGYGRKLSRMMTEISNVSQTMFNTRAMEFYAMSEFLDLVL